MKKEKSIVGSLAVIGLLLMYHTAGVEPGEVEIQEIDREMVGDKVTVEGEVENFTAARETVFFTLKDGNHIIPAVSFRENLLIHEGLQIKASGKVTIHRGETEFIINRIIRKN